MKVIDKKKFAMINSSSRAESLLDEVRILQAADHPNIIKYYDMIETDTTLYLILELVEGGDLFDKIVDQQGRGFPEDAARDMFGQMLSAVKYLHSKSIVHRDLKVRREHARSARQQIREMRRVGQYGRAADSISLALSLCPAQPENVLMKRRDTLEIRISDFGLSRVLGAGSFMKTMCGTPQSGHTASDTRTRIADATGGARSCLAALQRSLIRIALSFSADCRYLAPEVLIESSGGSAAPKVAAASGASERPSLCISAPMFS